MGGAPTVLNMIVNAPTTDPKPLPGKVAVTTGAAPPPPQVLLKMEELGFRLTETCGPGTVNTWRPEWDALPPEERAKMKARHGLNHIGIEEMDIRSP
ncbi:putative acyl-activating enzyme 1, peroxisomal [Cocos nucifera]|nr:putative acyl-activating enzyme 1, peroxisomal [Cocos nucifera]